VQRRDKAGKRPGRKRDGERESKNAPVKTHRDDVRNIPRGRRVQQNAQCYETHSQSRDAGQHEQQHAFGEQLAHQLVVALSSTLGMLSETGQTGSRPREGSLALSGESLPHDNQRARSAQVVIDPKQC